LEVLALMADLNAKREAKLAEKEKAKKDEIERIKAEKAAKQKGREDERAKGAADAKEKADKQAEAEAKRAANIQAKEEARSGKGAGKGAGKGQQGSSKYSKKDVLELKKVFDEYDNDGSGSITLSEFTKTLRDKKKSSAPKPGQKSTLADRQAAAGISLADLGEGVFHEMDADGNGDVSFRELLKLMFKFARPDEIETMLEWVAPEAEPEPEPKAGLTDEQQKEIKSIFKIYDKDKSGTITVAELVTALEKTGLEKDEIKDMFKNYDTDENATIDLTEFTKMMVDTGNYDPDM